MPMHRACSVCECRHRDDLDGRRADCHIGARCPAHRGLPRGLEGMRRDEFSKHDLLHGYSETAHSRGDHEHLSIANSHLTSELSAKTAQPKIWRIHGCAAEVGTAVSCGKWTSSVENRVSALRVQREKACGRRWRRIRYRSTPPSHCSHTDISPRSRPSCCGDRWVASGRFSMLADDLGLNTTL